MAKRKMPVTAGDGDDDDDYDDDGDDGDDDDDEEEEEDSNSRRVSTCSCPQYFGDFFTSSKKTQAFTTALTTDQYDT